MVALRTGTEVRNVAMGVFNPRQESYLWISICAVPQFRPDESQPYQVYTIFDDITDRRKAEEALRDTNDELTHFVYTVSHDLKSPLVTIKTFLGYLEKDAASRDAERMGKDLGYIRTAADKMSRLLDELSELSRVGRKVNPSVEVPLQTVMKEALDLVAGQIAERGAEVRVTAEPILLHGDQPRLVEAFQNLLDNAVKFMGDQAAPRIEIGAEPAGDEIVLFVRDNGIGIDPRHQAKLFGLFEKLDPHTEGTGLGLALVRRVVEVHGGRIWMESAGPGKGATFRFTLAKTKRQST
jgi:signal transduction histidine kinase